MAHAHKWSKAVTDRSDALDLERGVFESHDPKEIAESLAKSAEASDRRRATPFRSAMAMLTFFINRAGRTLPRRERNVLEEAKVELRRRFGKPPR